LQEFTVQRWSKSENTFRADRPNTSTYMGPIILLEQCDTFIRFQNKANISYPVGGPRRHKVKPKTHKPEPRTSNGETTQSRGNVEC